MTKDERNKIKEIIMTREEKELFLAEMVTEEVISMKEMEKLLTPTEETKEKK